MTKSTDGDWNVQPTIPHSNGYEEHETKLQTVSLDWSDY